MKTAFKLVKEFHKSFGHTVNSVPVIASEKDIKLRLSLILEEFSELVDACTRAGGYNADDLKNRIKAARDCIPALTASDIDIDLVSVADALTDINYVTYGGGHVFGINLDMCFDEVHQSNMSKLDDSMMPIFDQAGKILKSKNYRPPNLKYVIQNQMRQSFKILSKIKSLAIRNATIQLTIKLFKLIIK